MYQLIDSVSGMVPKAELEGDMGIANAGLQARLMSSALRKLTGPINKTGCSVYFHQSAQREIEGHVWKTLRLSTGGNACEFYVSGRIGIFRRIVRSKERDNIYGTGPK